MSLRDLVDGEAMRDDDENDADVAEDYEGDEGEVREGAGTVNHYNDSSEEDEEEDDDEEAARAVS
jgi:transcription elongation factor SPT6